MQVTLDPQAARAEHQRAVHEFIAAARAVPDDSWNVAPDATHWSPAQIAEHVRLSYEVVGAQLTAGGTGLRVRTPAPLRIILKWRFLGGILERGVFPPTAKAPREIRPEGGPFDRDALLAGLEAAARVVEDAFVAQWNDPSCRMTHHVFGALTPPQGARLVMVHTAHHARQLRQAARA